MFVNFCTGTVDDEVELEDEEELLLPLVVVDTLGVIGLLEFDDTLGSSELLYDI